MPRKVGAKKPKSSNEVKEEKNFCAIYADAQPLVIHMCRCPFCSKFAMRLIGVVRGRDK